MKGIGIGLLMTYILIIVVVMFSIVGFSFVSAETSESLCEKVVIDKVANWMQKMSLPAATSFDDEIKLDRLCVEFVDREGIKFTSGDNVKKFTKPNGDRIVFDLGESSRIFPRSEFYEVTIKPLNTIAFVGG